ncbi:MAG: hypothetical protein ABL982_26710, partial [Vicinamibacterales bacterium]
MTSKTHNRPHKELNAAEAPIGAAQQGLVQISIDDDPLLSRPDIQIVDGPNAMAYADEMAFMEERVIVRVETSTDPNAENPVPLWVNGISQYLFRGVPTVVRRCYVERLARCKLTSYKQALASPDPNEYNRLMMSHGLLYPFTVLRDDNPAGAPWLNKVLAER